MEEPSSSKGGGDEGEELPTLSSWWQWRGSGVIEGEDEMYRNFFKGIFGIFLARSRIDKGN